MLYWSYRFQVTLKRGHRYLTFKQYIVSHESALLWDIAKLLAEDFKDQEVVALEIVPFES